MNNERNTNNVKNNGEATKEPIPATPPIEDKRDKIEDDPWIDLGGEG